MEFMENSLSYEDYVNLRESVGWLNFSEKQARRALETGLYSVVALDNGQTVGMGRLLGDGMYYTVVDVVVRPERQGKGIGGAILDQILRHIQRELPEGGRASIQLISEQGKEAFYEKRGFKKIPHEFCGSGMRKILRK